MKCLSFIVGNQLSYGVLIESGLVDLGPVLGQQYPSLIDIIEAGKLELIAETIKITAPTLNLHQVQLCLPLPNVKRIFCVGRKLDSPHLFNVNQLCVRKTPPQIALN